MGKRDSEGRRTGEGEEEEGDSPSRGLDPRVRQS